MHDIAENGFFALGTRICINARLVTLNSELSPSAISDKFLPKPEQVTTSHGGMVIDGVIKLGPSINAAWTVPSRKTAATRKKKATKFLPIFTSILLMVEGFPFLITYT